jgi:hypothetical protein
MRKFAYVLCFIIATFLLNAKLINTNPDPNGDPWYVGGVDIPTADQQNHIDALPKLTLPAYYKNRKSELPYAVDNSLQPYFRPVFLQEGGSCAQASGVGYAYTYEQNFARGTSADIPGNQYPTHYTYNFLNSGSGDNGSVAYMGWDIIEAGGCPSVAEYGGMLWPSTDPDIMHKLWMNSYEKYENGMDNREIEQLTMPVGTEEGLEVLKQWFNDHCDGSDAGGVAVFSAGVYYDFQIDKLPVNSYCPGEFVVLNWDKNVNHAMTFVGYNDSIRWDYNNDGKFTNNIDITGDGKVDMQDWEIGGLRMVNSWGDSWADGGKSWVMYRTLAQDYTDGGIFRNIVLSIKVKEPYKPKLKLKTTISYNERNDISLIIGVSKNIFSTEPEYKITCPHFYYQGGDSIGMAGDGDIIELGLDITSLLDYIIPGEEAKIFLCVEQKRSDAGRGSGKIESLSIIDEDGTEFVSNQTDIAILNDSTTYASVFLPQALKISTNNLPAILPGIEYSYSLAAIKGTPPYLWEIVLNYFETENNNSYPSDTLTKLTMSNSDDGFANIDLPFEFPFFDNLYNSLTVTTNGAITFNGVYENVKILEDVYNTKTIAPCAADLKLVKKDVISYFVSENYAVVKWKASFSIPSGPGSGSSTASCDFAVKLYPDGQIEFFYGTFTSPLVRVCGVSNGSKQSTFISKISYAGTPSGLKTALFSQNYPFGMEMGSDGIFHGTLAPTVVREWFVTFKVTDDYGLSAFKELLLTVADPGSTLSAPLKPFIVKNEFSCILTWDFVQGATIYRVYRSTDPYSGFVQIGTSTSTSFEDRDLLPGNKYFYYITSDNSN